MLSDSRHRGLLLAMALIGGAASVVCLVVGRVYVEPLAFGDTVSYVLAASGDRWSNAFRTPLYGDLMLLGPRIELPWLILYIQVGAWIACVTLAAGLAGVLMRSASVTIVVGVSLILLELALMHALPSQWLLLTDPLYSSLVTLSVLFLAWGALVSHTWIVLASLWFIGIALAIRPIPIGVVILVPAIWMVFTRYPSWRMRACVTMGCFLLALGPIGVRSLANAYRFGTWAPTPLVGQHAVMYATALYRAGDSVFDDPEDDRAFAAVMQNDPRTERGRRALLSREPQWQALFDFYSSLAHQGDHASAQYEVSSISAGVALRLVRLHPVRYLELVLRQWIDIMIPDAVDRAMFWHPDMKAYYEHVIAAVPVPVDIAESFALTRRYEAAQEGLVPDVVRFLPSLTRLPTKPGPVSMSALFATLLWVSVVAIVLQVQGERRWRVAGRIVLLFLANSVFHALSQAAVTRVDDARFFLPGAMSLEIAVLLALFMTPIVVRIGAETLRQRENSSGA